MSYVVVCLVAFVASGLTLFSGFGLGTLLLPAFALFFPVEIAVSATAVVHLANNFFKLILVGRHANARAVLAFGLPAIPGALVGATALAYLSTLPDLARYTLFGRELSVTGVKLVIALLIAGFAVLELAPASDRLTFRARWLTLGGLLSGFFGGLSGHQGALRSAFLIQMRLSKQAFIGTGVVCAVLVDLTRITVYGSAFASGPGAGGRLDGALIAAATAAALVGAMLGVRLLGKVTLTFVRRLVGGMLLLLALAMGLGLV
jgi:uncharacterized membrane protein YfcA